MSGAAAPARPCTEIVLRSRRAGRALAAAAAQHATVAIMLVGAGLDAIQRGHGPRWLAVGSIVVGAALVVAAVLEMRALRRHGVEPGALPVVDLLAAPLLVLEGVHKHEQGSHLLPWAYALVALVTLAKVLAWPRLVRIRRLRLDSGGLDIRVSPFTRVRAAWSELRAVELAPRGVRLVPLRGAERVLQLDDLHNRAEVEAAVLAAAAAALPPPADPAGSATA